MLLSGRSGAAWEKPFWSVLVEPGDALRTVAGYIDLNPIRAGIAEKPEAYRWCSYAAALGGMRLARKGVVSVLYFAGRKNLTWAKAAAAYREYLYGIGAEVKSDGRSKSKGGFSQKEIAEVLAVGGRLTVAQALRCRVRYFSAGAVLGSQEFVDEFFERQREYFGEQRKSGGCRMKGAAWGGLRALRDLRVDAVRVLEG